MKILESGSIKTMTEETYQQPLFKDIEQEDHWVRHWQGMPHFHSEQEKEPEITAIFKFRNKDDFLEFKDTVQEKLYNNETVFIGEQSIETKRAWYPLNEKASKYRYVNRDKAINPRFPVYIVSKGRYKNNPTSKALYKMGVPFYIVVEEFEYDLYAQNEYIDKDNILILPKGYQDDYDVFWEDDDPRVGPGAARNFVWDHSINNGHDWHWVMDDNIENFKRLDNSKKVICTSGNMFYACEEFVLRYKNLAQAGLQYTFFVPRGQKRPAYKLNTRIYSCLLIRNDTGYRWRGRYNEDTDLSLRMLKDGWCTVQFNFFLQGKLGTQTLRGGNSQEFYDGEGTKNKSQMLVDMHPDVAVNSFKYGRWHHHVNYDKFRNARLILKDNYLMPTGVNNFKVDLVRLKKDDDLESKELDKLEQEAEGDNNESN